MIAYLHIGQVPKNKTRFQIGGEFCFQQIGTEMLVCGTSVGDDKLACAAQLHTIGAEVGGQ